MPMLSPNEFIKRAPSFANRVAQYSAPPSLTEPGRWDRNGLFVNLLTAIGILAVVGFACEWYVRRR